MSYVDVIDTEIANISHILDTIPFLARKPTRLQFFLNVYRPEHHQMQALNRVGEDGNAEVSFPVNANKLLKLGISLGNLIKSLQLDEELSQQQQAQQQQFVNNLNSKAGGKSVPRPAVPGAAYDPFSDASNTPASQLSKALVGLTGYQIKFLKNLLVLLKNFDIGNTSATFERYDLPNSTSNLTLNQYNGPNGSGMSSELFGASASPIKLNSKQLLIEKLEINISLDNLFIYKMVLKLIFRIFSTIKSHLSKANINSTPVSRVSSVSSASGDREEFENSSIFSYNSLSSALSELSISTDEYVRILRQILSRVNSGIVEPFVRLVVVEVVEPAVSRDFNSLINNI